MSLRVLSIGLAVWAFGCASTDRELDVDIDPSFAAVPASAVSATTPVAVVDVLVFQGLQEDLIPIRTESVPSGVRVELSAATTSHQATMSVYCSDPTPRQYSWTVIAENEDGFAASDDFTLLVTSN